MRDLSKNPDKVRDKNSIFSSKEKTAAWLLLSLVMFIILILIINSLSGNKNLGVFP